MPPKNTHDRFCWTCAKETTALKCSICVRCFHLQCVPEVNRTLLDIWTCPVCIESEAAAYIDKKSDLEALTTVVDQAIENERFNCLKHSSLMSVFLVNPMSLLRLKKQIGTNKSFEEFLSDAKWIEHNCSVMYNENHDKPKTATALLDYFVNEIGKVKLCAECYSNAKSHPESWLSMVCSKPHPIVWAKIESYGIYILTKLMSIDEQQRANVLLFGCSARTIVPTANCLLFSNTNTNRRRLSAQYTGALEEADLYSANICRKFGLFHYAEFKTAFDPSTLEQYVRDSIPGAFASDERMAESEALQPNSNASLPSTGDPTLTVRQGNHHRKRKSVNNSKNRRADLVSGAITLGGSEPLVESARIDGTQERPTQCNPTIDGSLETIEVIYSKPIEPKIEEDISDFEEYLPVQQNASSSLMSSQNGNESQIHERSDGFCASASNIFDDLTKSKTDEINGLKKEIESLKKEHDQKIAEKQIEIQMARDETKAFKSTLEKMIEKNRCLSDCLEKLVAKRRSLDEKYHEEMNECESRALEMIRRTSSEKN